ncbi:unnamed protein product [Lasius platythorax]|uniref:Uncharacterized protein n=1 Tax=Lasius platythorax TaxID=488582 RepID=A0AAV2ND06_9HYME
MPGFTRQAGRTSTSRLFDVDGFPRVGCPSRLKAGETKRSPAIGPENVRERERGDSTGRVTRHGVITVTLLSRPRDPLGVAPIVFCSPDEKAYGLSSYIGFSSLRGDNSCRPDPRKCAPMPLTAVSKVWQCPTRLARIPHIRPPITPAFIQLFVMGSYYPDIQAV